MPILQKAPVRKAQNNIPPYLKAKIEKVLAGGIAVFSDQELDATDLPNNIVSIPNPNQVGTKDAYLVGKTSNPVISKFRKENGLEASKKKAQLINPYLKYDATHQVVIDGTPTKDVDNDVQWIANLDRKDVGCTYTALYWVERIFQLLRDKMYPGVDEAFAATVAAAKAKGMSDGQEDELKRLLMYMGFGLKDAKFDQNEIEKETDGGITQAESNNYLSFPQHQVVCAMRGKACFSKAMNRLEGALERYAKNKPKIHKAAIDKKIASLKTYGFSNQEIANEVDNWSFPVNLKKAAKELLLKPSDLVLSNIPKLASKLSNGKAKELAEKRSAASTEITKKAWVACESTSFEQETAVRKLTSAYKLETPLWVVSKSPLKMAALLKGNRMLVAEVSDKGKIIHTAKLDKNFKDILNKSNSKHEAWAIYASSIK